MRCFLEQQKKSVVFIKKDDQRTVEAMLMSLRLLAPRKTMDGNITISHGKAKMGRFVSRHSNEGFEFAYVLKGHCALRHGKEKYEMREDDVVYFDATE